jgi:hypothetical protein
MESAESSLLETPDVLRRLRDGRQRGRTSCRQEHRDGPLRSAPIPERSNVGGPPVADSARPVRRTWLRPGTGALRFATVPQRPLSSRSRSPR